MTTEHQDAIEAAQRRLDECTASVKAAEQLRQQAERELVRLCNAEAGHSGRKP